MKSEKQFDCVEYKRAIQSRHAAESRTLSPDEKLERRAEWLSRSDNPAARLWREMSKKQKTPVSSR